jgi:DNA-binding protein HU-beta
MEEIIMNKTDLVAAVAAKAEISKKDAEAAVSAVIASITDALADGDKVALVGFGTFEVKERAARTGLNPRTGEKLSIPASKAPAFKAGKALKDAVK